MEPIISVKKLSKSYKIRHETARYLTLRDVLADTIRHPFKFLKKKAKRAVGMESEETFWALKDINFSMQAGETLGIIGANGSGKSTLLKILSQITPPTEGEIRVRGTMTSLLEVGTGFHPELTGRENISLNGAILGMTRKEIAEKFDRIVEFAGVEKFLDTPVKRYSSGMYVRLAFSVAAHMEPDILVVDEVLAVGDSEFQKKCLGKMEDITQKDGRTILFVSHNMSAIENLCQKCIVLKNGKIDYFGETKSAISHYMSGLINGKSAMLENKDLRRYGPASFSEFKNIEVLNEDNQPISIFKIGEAMKVKFDIELKENISNLEIGFNLNNLTNTNLSTFIGEWEGLPTKFEAGKHSMTCKIEKLHCFPGNYAVSAWLKRKNDPVDQQIDQAVQFTVASDDITGFNPDFRYPNMGVYQKSKWHLEKN